MKELSDSYLFLLNERQPPQQHTLCRPGRTSLSLSKPGQREPLPQPGVMNEEAVLPATIDLLLSSLVFLISVNQ